MKITKKDWMSRVGIMVIAAILVEAISIVQYQRIRSFLDEEMNTRARVVLGSMAQKAGQALELTEATMRENLWEVRRSLSHPDSVFQAMVRLIDDNPHVQGGCIAFVPDYYPSKGRLFEPYAYRENGKIQVRQIAGPEHDYTENPLYLHTLETGLPDWSDPYTYGPADSLLSLCTYSVPVEDGEGRVVAVCGLDLDLTWLGDTLNVRQHFKSSFSLMLTQEGKLVAGPPESRIPASEVRRAIDLHQAGYTESSNKQMIIRSFKMNREPYWEVVQVYRNNEVYARVRLMRREHMFLILLGLAILFFMIERFAHNEKKLRVATAEQARISGELEVARNVQQEMLPKAFPDDVYGSLVPAREVGGDVFDFFTREGKLFFCIGDVSGKGVPSAMLMSVTHSLFRIISEKVTSPSLMLKLLNGQLCRENDSNMFVTFFVGILDLYSGELCFSNAGHDKPFLLAGDVSLLPAKSNLPLGVFPDTVFEEQRLMMAPGSTLFLYTDGLTEAKDAERKTFGRERVKEVLAASLSLSPEQLVHAVADAELRFVGSAPQSDDLTMLALRFSPGNFVRDHITLGTDKQEVERLGVFIKDFCARLELDRKTASGLRLALEEMVVNVMNYAYPEGEEGSVSIQADSDRKEVRFTVTDSGKPFDPTSVLEADTTLDAQNRPIGGLGIHLARKMMDTVSYSRDDGKNVLTLTKSIV